MSDLLHVVAEIAVFAYVLWRIGDVAKRIDLHLEAHRLQREKAEKVRKILRG